ncbi:MAG TPA: winged helix-turn-helix domain-containing protein [Pyrinomonadaceae bacterium]|nr:winged helix-turn-helix domain-containing protein [Pyrinomonadaceae bacterium]
MQNALKSTIYELENFRLETDSQRLFERETNELVPLQPKAFELLLFFIENEGAILTKTEILDAVWKDSFVEEANLSQTVFVLRKALNDDRKNPRFIVTVPNRGYRFIAKVAKVEAKTPNTEIEPETVEIQNLKTETTIEEIKDQRSKTNTQSPISPKFFLLAIPLILIFAFGIYYLWRDKKPETVSEVKSIAILPFKNIGGKEDEDYLGNGISEVLVSKLSNIKSLVVRPATSVLKFTDASPDTKKIGGDLDVEAIVVGRVQKVDENIRVTVQLVRVSDGATLWADTFDDKFTNIFAVQDSISEKVTQSLALKITADEREQIVKSYTSNAEAYQTYLQGRFFWNKRTPDNLGKAVVEFEKANRLDPNFALAYVGLADCYVLLAEYRVMPPNESFPKARAAATKALEIDSRLAEARTSLAYISAFFDWDFPTAEREFKKAIEQNPNYATAHQWYAEYLQVLGKFDESLAELRRAEQIDPNSLIVKTNIARYFYFTRQYDKAIEQSTEILAKDPNFGWGYGFLWISYSQKQMFKEAAEAHLKSESLFGESLQNIDERKKAFAANGFKGYWKKWLEQHEDPKISPYTLANEKAIAYSMIGDDEKTLYYLQQSFDRRETWLLYVKYAPQFDKLQSNPRFVSILNRIGFN